MPELLASLIMKGLRRSKPQNLHYVPKDYAQERERARKQNAMQPLPRKIRRSRAEYGIWYARAGAERSKVVFYIHGGGFNSGGAEDSYNMVKHLCPTKAWSVFSAEYRLAPEHPYPEGLEDCVRAYRWLLGQGVKGENIVLAGDSAGGNLAFATALFLRDHRLPMPAGLCCFSPVGAVDASMPSRSARADRDCMIGADFTEEMAATYVRNHDPKEPYLSPVYASFEGLPPIWMCVGTEEVFYDDAFALQEKARKAGVPVELVVGEGMCHVYPMLPDRESRRAVKSMLRFLESRLLRRNS